MFGYLGVKQKDDLGIPFVLLLFTRAVFLGLLILLLLLVKA